MDLKWKERLVGPVVSLPTFNDDKYNLLLDRQRIHVRWLMDQGISEGNGVLLISGGVGETYMLNDDEYFKLVDLLTDEVKGTVPTMVMISETGARRAAMKAKYAADAGIDYALLSPPHYSSPTEDDIFLHHEYVNGEADIGIMVYNSFWVMPNGYEFSAGLFDKLATLENVISVKWSSSNFNNYIGMVKHFKHRFTFIDNMSMYSFGHRVGMKGFIDMVGNAVPRLSLHLWDLLKEEKYDEYDRLWFKIKGEPMQKPNLATDPSWSSVGDAWHALTYLKLLGLDAGPAMPGQAPPSVGYVEHTNKILEEGGMKEWSDWNQSLFG